MRKIRVAIAARKLGKYIEELENIYLSQGEQNGNY